MVTLVSSSPCHQPCSCCRSSRWSRARSSAWVASSPTEPPSGVCMRACVTVIPLLLSRTPSSLLRPPRPLPLPGGDELRDRHELGPDVLRDLRLGQALAGRAELGVGFVLGPAAAARRLAQPRPRGPAPPPV